MTTLVETLRVDSGKIPLWNLHLQRLKDSLQKLGVKKKIKDDDFSGEIFSHVKNKSGKLRILVSINEKEIINVDVEFSDANVEVLSENNFLKVDIFPEPFPEGHNPHNLKYSDYPFREKGMKMLKENNIDELIFLNSKGEVVEGLNSNIFIIRKGKVFTPPLSSGCVDGVFRKFILKNLKDQTVNEKKLFISDIFDADEIIFTNAFRGLMFAKFLQHKEFMPDHYSVG